MQIPVRLQAASCKQINDARQLKEQLMTELAEWITQHHLKQADAAEFLMVSRPRVSDVVNKKTAKFTIDTLVTAGYRPHGCTGLGLAVCATTRT